MLKDTDRLALEVLRSAQVDAARADMEALYRADPNAASPLARGRIGAAVANYAFAAAQAAVCDPWRPYLPWRNAEARTYAGLEVPSGRFGGDNPDNVYRWGAVAPECSYRIDGQVRGRQPAFITFSLLSGDYAETTQIRTVGILSGSDLVMDADGRFAITIDAHPANGRPNHIQSTPDTRLLNIRETLGDWASETPLHLTMCRTDDAPTPPEPSLDQLAARAALILRDGAPQWALGFQHDSYEKMPFNQMQPIMSSAKRLGGLVTQSSSHGRFALAEDEALVVSVDPFDADYLGFQLADVWMVAADYVGRPGSLNNFQAQRGADGRFTFVIARVDPGIDNWLDAGGLDTGATTIRYQGLKNPDLDYSGAFRTWHGKLADLDAVLPADAARSTPAQRAQQIAQRIAAYRRREDALVGQ